MKTMCADVIRCLVEGGRIDPQAVFVPIEFAKAELRPVLSCLREMIKWDGCEGSAWDSGKFLAARDRGLAILKTYAKF